MVHRKLCTSITIGDITIIIILHCTFVFPVSSCQMFIKYYDENKAEKGA